MKETAVRKVAFLGKAPKDRSELTSILEIASKLMERADAGATVEEPPTNIIPFPVRRS